jgi:hypothetical protein
VRRNAVQYRASLNDDVRHGQSALKDARAVWLCEDGLLERVANLAPVYVKRRDKFDIATAIAANGLVHDAFDRNALAIAVVLNALHQRAGAIADAGNGYFDVVSQTNPPISRKNKNIETRPRGKSASPLALSQMQYVWRSGHMAPTDCNTDVFP